ncbi:methyltransferase domain-containing protein [Candidatus Woesearchaeota archaeon]|nr:methyltransferase domain-containing protein [Candidatus Woesearchaeota archaeon]
MTFFKEIKTKDGSVTYHNQEFDDYYHSISVGAVEEATKKYVAPAKLKENATILDFCFGLGYNSLASIQKLRKASITGLEIDEEILEKISQVSVPKEYTKKYEIIKKASKEALEKKVYKDKNYDIRIVLGDAKKSVKELETGSFDAILFDPFSPKKNSDLWTKDVFDECFRVLKQGGVLTTYSYARSVRENLKNAGFKVYDGPVLGRRSPSTIAVKEAKTF